MRLIGLVSCNRLVPPKQTETVVGRAQMASLDAWKPPTAASCVARFKRGKGWFRWFLYKYPDMCLVPCYRSMPRGMRMRLVGDFKFEMIDMKIINGKSMGN